MFNQQYTVVETIGTNPSKMTSLVKDVNGNYFVSKRVHITDPSAANEIQLMKKMCHPNLISLHDLIHEGYFLHQIEEYCEEGDLNYHILRQRKLNRYFSEETVSQWCLQLLLAIEYLHHQKIIHRDIRPTNIFLTSTGNIKLGSFRCSKALCQDNELAQTSLHFSSYLAPEVFNGQKYDFKIDIYAFGQVLSKLCGIKVPKGHTQAFRKHQDLPTFYSKKLNNVYLKCVQNDPTQRCSARELLKMSYFLDVLRVLLANKGNKAVSDKKIPIKKYAIHRKKMKCPSREKISDQQRDVKRKIMLPKICLVQLPQHKKGDQQQNRVKREMSGRKSTKTRKVGQNKSREGRSNSVDRSKGKNSEESVKRKLSKGKATKVQESYQNQARKKQFPLSRPPMLPKPKKLEVATPKRYAHKEQDKSTSRDFVESDTLMQKQDQFEYTKRKMDLSTSLSNPLSPERIYSQPGEFQIEEESNTRLTGVIDEQEQLLRTCEFKLLELVQQINEKYCPDMESIPQKTIQFDSNTFANFTKNAIRIDEINKNEINNNAINNNTNLQTQK